ncbi:MAG TPA: hypothetical protein VGJ48_27520 [Pyrinomonadaceae bacterium]|jgi:hypothetical protein
MFKMEETAADEGDITGAIFMRPDGMFEGRIYRKQTSTTVVQQTANQDSEFEICAVTGTLIQARILVHEELGCNGNGCHYCRPV